MVKQLRTSRTAKVFTKPQTTGWLEMQIRFTI
jgi:hypothetical protein